MAVDRGVRLLSSIELQGLVAKLNEVVVGVCDVLAMVPHHLQARKTHRQDHDPSIASWLSGCH